MTGTVSQVTGQVTDAMGLTAEGVVPVSSRELFWRARYLRASTGLGHLPFLFWLFSDLQPRRAVTLNIGEGVLHFAACQAIDKLSTDAICRGYGTWNGDGVPETLQVYNEEQYEDFSRLEEADAEGAARRHQAKSVDLLVIEAPDARILTAVQESWPDRLSTRGVVLVTGSDALDEAARDRMDALETAYPTLRLEHGGGLRVVLLGEDAPDRLVRLAKADPTHPALMTFARIFGRLGAMHVNEWAARDKSAWARRLSEALKKSQEDVEALEQRGQALQAQLDRVQHEVKTASDAAARDGAAARDSNAALEGAQKDIARLRAWIESLKSDLADARTSASEQAAAQTQANQNLQARADQLSAQLDAATRTRDDTVAALQAVQVESAEWQDKVNAVQEDLQSARDESERLRNARDDAQQQTKAKDVALTDAKAQIAAHAAQLTEQYATLSQAKSEADAQAKSLALQQDSLLRAEGLAAKRGAELAGLRAELAGVRGALRAARREMSSHGPAPKNNADEAQRHARNAKVLTGALRATDAARVAALQRAAQARQIQEHAAARDRTELQNEKRRGQLLARVLDVVDDARANALGRLRQSQSESAARIAALCEERDALLASQEQLTAKVTLAERATASLRAELSTVRKAETDARASAESAQAVLARTRVEAEQDFALLLDTLADAQEISIRHSEELASTTRALRETKAALKGEGLDFDPIDLQSENASLRDTIDRLREEIVRQSDDLAAAEQALVHDEARQIESAKVEELKIALAKERSRLKETEERYGTDLANTQEALAQARAEVASKTTELETLSAQQSKSLQTLTNDLRHAQSQLAGLAAHNAQLEHDVQAIRDSTSWRVTAPMRQITTALRRPK